MGRAFLGQRRVRSDHLDVLLLPPLFANVLARCFRVPKSPEGVQRLNSGSVTSSLLPEGPECS